MKIDNPLVRASNTCPICHGEKHNGLVACWPCYRSKVTAWEYSDKAEAMIAARERYLRSEQIILRHQTETE